ncbi:hypothetical protein [Vibrio parahaemolyticus]|uniref:hypothetical protein n=1 Tax=Vibrio parahaemolyticus TaxID=670 RepID=UPI000A4B400A|nr:hypothetical protein [Vibrio parahaemolyticus]
MVDPRLIHRQCDSELIALWRAHFALKNEAMGHARQNPSQSKTPKKVIDLPDVNQQIAACERLLM